MPDEEVSFEDMESGSTFSKEEITIKGIVLGHLKKICLISCDEFTGGYYNTVTEWHGELRHQKKVYVPDTRAKYCQAIGTLYDLLLPFCDKAFLDKEKAILSMKEDTPEAKVLKSRTLLRELSRLLHRKNYLSE